MTESRLLAIDAIANLGLGLLLLTFPSVMVEFLGIPRAESAFYPSVLGAVLIGIGIALLLACRWPDAGGLGLAGAIAINLCGGLALTGWLLLGDIALPTRGHVLLASLALFLVGISTVEARMIRKRRNGIE